MLLHQIHIRIYADKELVLDTVFDRTSPPLRFSVPVAGAAAVTTNLLDLFPPAAFYLADAQFASNPPANSNRRIPEAGDGFVEFNHPGEALMQEFVPGSIARWPA